MADVQVQMAAHRVVAHPCLVEADAHPSDPPGVAPADHRPVDRPPARPLQAPRILALAHVPAHGLGYHRLRRRQPAGAVRGQARRRDVRDVVRVDGRDRMRRSDPDRQFRGNGRQFRGGDGWRDPEVRTRPRPAGLLPPGALPSARARPPAARHTGRATLPSAIFPHTLPADPQIPGPSDVAQHSRGPVTGKARHIPLRHTPQLAVLQRYSITRGQGYAPDV